MVLPFVVSGLVTGAIYGLAAVGLVLTYKTSGVFNFAHGALATVSAYLMYALYVQADVPWPLAALICIFVAGPIMALGFERLARVLAGRGLALSVTSTVGVLLIVQAAALLIYPPGSQLSVPIFLADGQFEIFGTFVQYSDLITFVFALCATGLLYAFFRISRMGMAMRAVVDNADLLEIQGTSASFVRRCAWLIGVGFACATGVLFSTLLNLDPTVLTLLVVQAFGAAAIGAFTSLPLTFAGGLLIGVAASLSTKYFTDGFFAGLPPALPFIVLFVVLLVFPRKYLAERSVVVPAFRPSWTTPLPLQLVGGAAVIVFLALVPSFAGIHLTDWTIAVGNIIIFLSLGLLVRTSGQVSLCHVTFMAIGASSFGQLVSHGVPWLPSLLLCCLIAVPVGALLAIPAIRLTPLYLALATFGFGIFVQYMFYTQDFMFGKGGSGLLMPRPGFLGMDSDRGFYYLVLAIAVLAALLVVVLNNSRLGRLLRGASDSQTAVSTSGATIKVTWVLVFCLSGAMAAGGGALIGMASETTSIPSYPPLLSLTYLALILITIGGAPWYAVLAGLALIVPPSYISSPNTGFWLQIIFGLFAVLYAFTPDSARGVPPALQRRLDAWFRRGVRATPALPVDATGAAAPAELAGAGALAVENLQVRFGGIVAVEDVTLSAPTGRITGLIGPNGAGKTTTFNVCSGLLAPTSGVISLDESNIGRSSPPARARRGLGRTFQHMQLFDSLTVWENVSIGAEGALAGSQPVRHVLARRGDEARIREATARALDMCGIAELADTPASALSTGHRRLVELARCLAGPFRILLLDEPSSGLDRTETARFGEILERVVRERGVGILLVEHDMSLVMDVCEHIYVLDFGRLIYEGSPEQVAESPLVRAAYLGGQEVEDAVDRDDDALEPTS